MKKPLVILGTLGFAVIAMAADPAPVEAPGLKFSGFMQFRYEDVKNPRVLASDAGDAQISDYGPANTNSQTRELVWLNVDNQFDGHTRFHGVLAAEHLGGRTTTTDIQLKEGFVEAKFDATTVAVGRFFTDVGLGTLGGAPYMDGVHIASGNSTIKARVYLTRFGNPGDRTTSVADKGTYTYLSGDVKVFPIQGLTLSGSFFTETSANDPAPNLLGGALYKSSAFGIEYKHVVDKTPWFTLSGEYGVNSAAMAKKINGTTTPYAGLGTSTSGPTVEGSAPKAYFMKAQLLGANPFMPGTGGIYVQYRFADAGFDVMGMASPTTWNAPFNWTDPSGGGIANNEKGIEVGAEITVLPRLVLKATAGFMKLSNMTSTLDVGSPALAVVSTVTPTNGAPVIGMCTGTQNKENQNYFTAAAFYIF
jgi:hypothetical protein